MTASATTSTMDSLAHLATIELSGWQLLHRDAVITGDGLVIDAEADDELAADELIAAAVVELVQIGALAACADGPGDPPIEFLDALRDTAAGGLRLLDRALAADGRDTGYLIQAWRQRAMHAALAQAAAVHDLGPESPTLLRLVVATADSAASALTPLCGDRFAVPEGLCNALASLLVVFAAAVGPRALG